MRSMTFEPVVLMADINRLADWPSLLIRMRLHPLAPRESAMAKRAETAMRTFAPRTQRQWKEHLD